MQFKASLVEYTAKEGNTLVSQDCRKRFLHKTGTVFLDRIDHRHKVSFFLDDNSDSFQSDLGYIEVDDKQFTFYNDDVVIRFLEF